jgi:hypothetical protein
MSNTKRDIWRMVDGSWGAEVMRKGVGVGVRGVSLPRALWHLLVVRRPDEAVRIDAFIRELGDRFGCLYVRDAPVPKPQRGFQSRAQAEFEARIRADERESADAEVAYGSRDAGHGQPSGARPALRGCDAHDLQHHQPHDVAHAGRPPAPAGWHHRGMSEPRELPEVDGRGYTRRPPGVLFPAIRGGQLVGGPHDGTRIDFAVAARVELPGYEADE